MNEEIVEEFNERFATIEESLKYVADSQAKSEFIRKRENAEFNKKLAKIQKLQEQIQKHLDHITRVMRFNIEEYKFQDEKLVEAGKSYPASEKNNL